MPENEHHPFLGQHGPNVDNIYYEDKRSMSIKLDRVHNDDEQIKSFLNARLGLTNYWDFYYVGNLYVGSNLEKLRIIWDTGSEWLVI